MGASPLSELPKLYLPQTPSHPSPSIWPQLTIDLNGTSLTLPVVGGRKTVDGAMK